jgi:hypothetical protein
MSCSIATASSRVAMAGTTTAAATHPACGHCGVGDSASVINSDAGIILSLSRRAIYKLKKRPFGKIQHVAADCVALLLATALLL